MNSNRVEETVSASATLLEITSKSQFFSAVLSFCTEDGLAEALAEISTFIPFTSFLFTG